MMQSKVLLTILVMPLLLIQGSASHHGAEASYLEDGCTTVLAAGNATSDGSIILAKNRDLSEYEIQWLYRAPRESHPVGARVRLQYIEIPQVEDTWAWVGSKSYTKKWGVGMGVNEWGVAVADNDAPTREPLEGEGGLHDNDICRLILERSRTAREGMQVAGALLEEYGHSIVGEIYWIADSEEAWIVEGAGNHWAAVRVTDGVAVRANQFQITTHWDVGSDDLVDYAISRGWCSSAESFDFARCYSKSGYPYKSSQTRFERGHELLKDKVGGLSSGDLMEVLADHYEGTHMYETAHDNPDYRTICSRRTVSAMVAHLMPETPPEMQVIWYCMSSPCVGVFIPVFANFSAVPVPYLTGEGPEDISNYNEESAWWAFKRIQLLVDEDYDERHAEAREVWDGLYDGSVSDMDRIEGELRSLFQAGEVEEARRMMDSFVEGKLMEAYESALQMVEELSGAESGVEEEPSESLPEDDGGQDGEVILYVGVFLFMALVAGVLLLFVKRESGGLRT